MALKIRRKPKTPSLEEEALAFRAESQLLRAELAVLRADIASAMVGIDDFGTTMKGMFVD
jgi:hypothetical protein